MIDEELREKARREIENFLEEKKYQGFDMWRWAVMDLQKAFADTIPYDTRRGGIPALYEAGRVSGERTGQWLMENFDLSDKSIKERTHYTDALFPLIGLGDMEFVKEPERILRFKKGTFFGKKITQFERNICYYVAGFIAGATYALTNIEVEVTETKCVARGDEHCDFKIKPKKGRG